ncbi:hypothetical protein FCR2A7T_10290 [Flavobacterium cauense R2A-7]|nr:hypothetical protein FCR2A7T_10290 [Flavobacterium cauense R2A-7]
MALSGIKSKNSKPSVASEKGLKSQYFQHFHYNNHVPEQ